MNRITLILLVISLGLAAAPDPLGAATIYRWVDKDGTVHFGEQPPEGVEARPVEGSISTVNVPQRPQPVAVDSSGGAGEEAPKSLAQQRREERAEAHSKAREEESQRQLKCQAMREQLAWTEPNPRVIVQDADGTTRRMDDAERLELVNEAKDYLANNDCE